jgi:hypothetical protein
MTFFILKKIEGGIIGRIIMGKIRGIIGRIIMRKIRGKIGRIIRGILGV